MGVCMGNYPRRPFVAGSAASPGAALARRNTRSEFQMGSASPAWSGALPCVVELFPASESEQRKNLLEEERAAAVASGKSIGVPWGGARFPLRFLRLGGGEYSSTVAFNAIFLASVNVY